MNLKNFFIPLLAVATMVSCSKDDDLGPQEPDMTPDCWFSLAVDTDTQTKTRAGEDTLEDDSTLPRNIISDLAVFVYINGQYYASGDTTLADAQKVNSEIKTLSTVNRIPVKAGNVKVLVVANAGKETIDGMKKNSLEAVTKTMVYLQNEKHKYLSMSSQVFEVTLKPGKNNYVGYGTEVTDPNGFVVAGATSPLKLYRNVARIQLSSLTLNKESAYGTPVSFKLDSIFVANVKGSSHLCPTDGEAWGPVGDDALLANSSYWWFGACPGMMYGDSLTNVKPAYPDKVDDDRYSVMPYLCIPFDKDYSLRDYYNAGETYSVSPITLDSDHLVYEPSKNNEVQPIGHFFYAYENLNPKVGFQTLLVVRGDYTYKPNGSDEPVTEYNRYYTLVVNPKGTTSFAGVTEHVGVRRNTKYSINLTISGSGSDKPYDPAARAYIGGTVKVLNWGVIEVVQSAD